MATVPVNFRGGAIRAADAADAAQYATQVFANFLRQLSIGTRVLRTDSDRMLEGVAILELGPGRSLGTAVLLACAGARVSVADRFMPAWDDEYHAPVFEALLEMRALDGWPVEQIQKILQARSFDPAVKCYPFAAEQLTGIDGQFDVVLSNAVLEHVEDLGATAYNLAAKTRPGGIGIHQIDLRDHRDFTRPLEYLTLSPEEVARIRQESHCECGGVWRAADVAAAFDTHGFDVQVTPNMHAAAEYLVDVRPRLQPPFSSLADAELGIISALFHVRRRADDR